MMHQWVSFAILEIPPLGPSTPLCHHLQPWLLVLIAVYTAFLAHASLNLALSRSIQTIGGKIDALIWCPVYPPVARQVWDVSRVVQDNFHDIT